MKMYLIAVLRLLLGILEAIIVIPIMFVTIPVTRYKQTFEKTMNKERLP